MTPMIKRVLYATDLSPNSIYALRFALKAAKPYRAEIVVLHVFEHVYPHFVPMLDVYVQGKEQKRIVAERVTQAKAIIKSRLNRVMDENIVEDSDYAATTFSIALSEGFPAERILRTADEYDCDLIVMGTHGKGLIGNTFLGSTAKRVLRRTRKPVFIIPLPRELPEPMSPPMTEKE